MTRARLQELFMEMLAARDAYHALPDDTSCRTLEDYHRNVIALERTTAARLAFEAAEAEWAKQGGKE